MSKEKNSKKNAGKGMTPKKGYSPRNWYDNYPNIDWHNKWCAYCGRWTNHTSGECKQLKKDTK